MRPFPQSRHIIAVALMAGVAALSGCLAFQDTRFSDDQVFAATSAIKRAQGELFTHDIVYGDGGPWRLESPVISCFVQFLMTATGTKDLPLLIRCLTGPLVMLYLCGMYALLYRQTRNWSVSLFVSILSMTVIHTLGGGFWGAGSLSSVTPLALVTALSPLVLLPCLKYEALWQRAIVFLCIGLLGNIHLPSAVNLGLVTLGATMAQRRFAWPAWPAALVCATALAIGTMPYVAYAWMTRVACAPADARIVMDTATQALRLGGWEVLYPEVFRGLTNWLPLIGVMAAPAAAVLVRRERYNVRYLSFWLAFAAGALGAALLLQGFAQVIGMVRNELPPALSFVQASSLLMLPLYVLLAQGLTDLFRILHDRCVLLRWLCAAFAAAWMIPSDNLRVMRHMVSDTATMFIAEANKPRYVRQNHERQADQQELLAISRWARLHSDDDAVFLVDRPEFRMHSHRAVLGCRDDVSMLFYYAPWRLPQWTSLISRQRHLLALSDPSHAAALREFVDQLAASKDYAGVKQWFVILKSSAHQPLGAPLTPVPADGWGRVWQVYQVR